VVRIRYSELPADIHVAITVGTLYTIIYLQPGLSPAQRREALTRARSLARMRHGRKLHATSMAKAIVADRLRTSASTAAAAMRRHPVVLAVPLVVLTGAAVVLVAVSAPPIARPSANPAALRAFVVGAGQGLGRSAQVSLRREHLSRLPSARPRYWHRHWRSHAGTCLRFGSSGVCVRV
jgi:hypothetical protein